MDYKMMRTDQKTSVFVENRNVFVRGIAVDN